MVDIMYPGIDVELTKAGDNAFSLLARVRKAMRRGDVPTSDIEAFTEEATSGDYDHMLQTCMKWVNVS